MIALTLILTVRLGFFNLLWSYNEPMLGLGQTLGSHCVLITYSLNLALSLNDQKGSVLIGIERLKVGSSFFLGLSLVWARALQA